MTQDELGKRLLPQKRVGAPVNYEKIDGLEIDKKLILDCYNLDENDVKIKIGCGANVNGRYGKGDTRVFMNKWDLGWCSSGNSFTPLLALSNASKFPPPTRDVKNTEDDLDWARNQRASVPDKTIASRRLISVQIFELLYKSNCDLNVCDDHGATALYNAVYEENDLLALALIKSGAEVKTQTGIYIDGPGGTTPLHYAAIHSLVIVEALLQAGANKNAKDSNGKTAFDWAIEMNGHGLSREDFLKEQKLLHP
jgi:hypothetical protein